MPRKRKYNLEKGSVAVYAIATVFCFLFILGGIFASSTSIRKNQLKTLIKIKEIYAQQLNQADEIAANLKQDYVQDGLVLHYDGIDNTGSGHSSTVTTWTDLSGNGNDATINGGTWSDNCITFSEDVTSGDIKTNNNFSIDYSNQTFNIVFRYSSIDGVDPLFASRTSYSDGFFIFNYNEALTLDTLGSGTRTSVGDKLQINTNYNLTSVCSAENIKIYINGVLVSTNSATNATLNYPLYIFSDSLQHNSFGNVYSVKVYNRSLTEEEVLQNYQVDNNKYGF